MANSIANYTKNPVSTDAQRALDRLAKEQKKEIEINEDGSVTFEIEDETQEGEEQQPEIVDYNEGHYANIVDKIPEDARMELSVQLKNLVQVDMNSRSEWLRTIELGFDLLGTKVEEKNEPFEGACSAQHPLLMESAVKFQSKASNELLPAGGPVKARILGDITAAKEAQANRIKAHMNYQLTEEMTEFYVDSERLLLYLPLIGSCFKKTYYDAGLGRAVSEMVPADQLIVPNSASDLHRAKRFTHVIYKTADEMEECFYTGFYKRPDDNLLGDPTEPKLSEVQKKTHRLMGMTVGMGEADKVYTLYEIHVVMHIEGIDELTDGEFKLASPYIITVDSNSGCILSVRRNWREDDEKKQKIVPFTHYVFVPSFNFYGFGFLHLLGNLQLTLTAALRSLVDAGQFANLQGGFKLKGVRFADDGKPIRPGQFKEVESTLMDLNKSIMPLPFKEPSQVLYQMLEYLTGAGQKFADSTEQVVADSTNYGPVGTTLALLDASTKFFSAIHKRLHNSLKNELKLIARINGDTLPDELEYNAENETMQVSRLDYDESRVDVVPVSDPNIPSNAHRLAKAQTLFQIANQSPNEHDMREVLKHVYLNMDFGHPDRFLKKEDEATQNDPMTDIQNAVMGKPIKAFRGQDHKAHIAIKQAFMQDPMSGGNPMMQKASLILQANIQEHMMLNFQEMVEAGTQQGMQPEQAAAQVAQMNLQAAQAQAQPSNPRDQAALLMAQAELLDTKIQERKQAFSELLQTAKLELDKEELDLARVKESNKMTETKMKMNHDLDKIVQTKGLDAMIAGLSNKSKSADTKKTE